MWHRWRKHGHQEHRWGGHRGFGGGFSPFGFWSGMGRPFLRRSDYVRMLERYKEDLEAELEKINEDLVDLKQGKDSD